MPEKPSSAVFAASLETLFLMPRRKNAKKSIVPRSIWRAKKEAAFSDDLFRMFNLRK
jgi:hypothetical protein